MKTLLENLRDALAQMAEPAKEIATLDERERKAKAELTALSGGKLDDKAEVKAMKLTTSISLCQNRRAKIESSLSEQTDALMDAYYEACAAWNKQVHTRREIIRSTFLTANLRFFRNDEAETASRLAGIMLPEMAPLARAVWPGFGLTTHRFSAEDCDGVPPALRQGQPAEQPNLRTQSRTIQEIDCFFGFLEKWSGPCGIPLD